jgi:nucleotide-binding universal stress UspA family protein
MSDTLTGAVIAGVDGSSESWAAVRYAAWEAQRRGRSLALVHGYFERLPYAAFGWAPYQPVVADLLTDSRAMLTDTAKRIGEEYPDLFVHTHLSAGGGSGVLVQASRRAGLIVVGARGHGGFAGLSIGSVAAQTAAHASCPVMVIRGPEPDMAEVGGPVVVGIDGSPHDDAVLAFAFEEAALRGAPVVGIHVWWFPHDGALEPEGYRYDSAALEDEAARVVSQAMAGWAQRYPDITVVHRPTRGLNPSAELIDESATAGLVVVGCRGRGGFASLLLGSVGRDLIGHAQAPVAVVHDHLLPTRP